MNENNSQTRFNHYVPRWFQKGFLLGDSNQLYYLDLYPDEKTLSDGRKFVLNNCNLRPPSKCFGQTDLYTTFFGPIINDEIEQKLFGEIDRIGAQAIRAFINNDIAEWIRFFTDFISYVDAQKIRTPKGLDWIKKHYSNLPQNRLMIEMQAIYKMHSTIWSEGVREIVSAINSKVKFIITDHPVTIYNYVYPPESPECRYPDDPSIALKGTQTLFPLNLDQCLIFTNYEYAKNPEDENPIEKRANARYFRDTMVRADAFIKSRFLSEEEVHAINFVLKKRARRYIASPVKEWLFPESNLSGQWSEIRKVLLPPVDQLYRFGGEIFAGYADGTTYYQDAFGRTFPENKLLNKSVARSQLGRNDFCGCGSGKKYKFCCLNKDEKLRPSWKVLSIRERNIAFYEGVNNILSLNKGKMWNDIRRELNNDQVKKIHELYRFLWPPDTDIFSLLPKPDNELRAIYTGIIDPRVISDFAIGLTPYFDEMLIQHPFVHPDSVKPEYSPIQSPHLHKSQTLKNVFLLITLMPFIDAGIINFIPNPCYLDQHLNMQMLKMATEREKNYTYDKKHDALLKKLIEEDMMRNIFMLSKEQKISHFTRINPKLSAVKVESLLKFMETKFIDDPFTLLQENVLSEHGGQYNLLNIAPNLEMSLFIGQVSSSILLTDRPFRWEEIIHTQQKDDSELSHQWDEICRLINRIDLIIFKNIEDCFRLRNRNEFKVIRKALKDIHTAKRNHDILADSIIFEKLKHELLEAIEISKSKALHESPNNFTGKLTCLLPQGGFYESNVQRMLLTSGSDGDFNNVSMALFIDQ